MKTDKKELAETLKKDAYPLLLPASLKDIFSLLLLTHEPDGYGTQLDMEGGDSFISEQDMLGCLMVDVPVFYYSLLYEILECTVPKNHARSYMLRLVDKGCVKSVHLPAKTVSDKEIQSIYYLSKAGYNSLVGFLTECCPYRSKNGQRLAETAMHDIGISAAYLSLVRSPFTAHPAYEVANMFDKATMPAGKFMRRNLRPDAVIDYYSDLTYGKLYIEHDTGSESVSRMMDKLNLYHLHGILSATLNGTKPTAKKYEQNAIIYTYRKLCKNRPTCFSARKIRRLAGELGESTLDVFTSEDATIQKLLSDLSRWTPAVRKKWGKEELLQFADRIDKNTDPSLLRYLRYYQRKETLKRRNAAFNLLIREFKMGDRSVYYPAILEMFDGYPVWFCPYNSLTNSLPAFFMQDYPQTIDWIKNVLRPYYGEVSYTYRRATFTNHSGGRDLCLSNIFETESGEHLSVEYISCDLSALIRLYAICNAEYELKSTPFNFILLVDSYKDASDILDRCNPLFKMGVDRLFKSGVLDIAFLSLTGNYLFSLTPDGKEVRLVN